MKYANKPRDYELGGFVYDARVLAASSWYVNVQHEAPLVLGLDDELDRQVVADLAAIAEIFDSRADGIHRPVRWAKVDRLVCTCALLVRSAERLATPLGHLDVRMRPARTVVVELPESPRYLAACQECGASQQHDDVAAAREWTGEHTCTPSAATAPESAGLLEAIPLADGEHPDDVVHHRRAAARSHSADENG